MLGSVGTSVGSSLGVLSVGQTNSDEVEGSVDAVLVHSIGVVEGPSVGHSGVGVVGKKIHPGSELGSHGAAGTCGG